MSGRTLIIILVVILLLMGGARGASCACAGDRNEEPKPSKRFQTLLSGLKTPLDPRDLLLDVPGNDRPPCGNQSADRLELANGAGRSCAVGKLEGTRTVNIVVESGTARITITRNGEVVEVDDGLDVRPTDIDDETTNAMELSFRRRDDNRLSFVCTSGPCRLAFRAPPES